MDGHDGKVGWVGWFIRSFNTFLLNAHQVLLWALGYSNEMKAKCLPLEAYILTKEDKTKVNK